MSGARIGAVVLAAGESARMGEPKQSLRFGGETLLRRAALAALGSSCRPVVVVLGSNAEELKKEIDPTGARVVVNGEWAGGMSSSIRCGLRALEEAAAGDVGAGEFEVDEVKAGEVEAGEVEAGEVEAAVFLLCDQPLVTSETIERIVGAYRTGRAPLVVSEYEAGGEKTRGVPALFSRRLFDELKALQGAEGARRVIGRHAAEAVFVAAPEAAFDVDTPDDYRALRELAARDSDV